MISLEHIALLLFVISFAIIFIGMVILFIAPLTRKREEVREGGVEGGAVIILGPFPIAIGSRRIIKPLLLVSIIFFILVVVIYLLLVYLPNVVFPR